VPGPAGTPLDRAHVHAARFNEAVVVGGWAMFAERFAPDATLRFPDVPVPAPYGRDAILAAYDAQPPDETLRVLEAATDPDEPGVDVVRFAWASGATGTMRIRWSGDLVADLAVTFD
jgi:steroid delta-isomerase